MAHRVRAAEAPLQFELFSMTTPVVPAEIIELPQAPLARAVIEVVAPSRHGLERAVWPRLAVSVPSGEVAKFDANVKAIELLKALQAEGRNPSLDERAVLNAYSGWGSLGQKFASQDKDWVRRIEKLDALLNDGERESVRNSVNNAHYTPSEVIDVMWELLRHVGFKGGRIIEPSAGTGFFIGGMPEEIAKESAITAIEIDSVSAGITDKLYGEFGVQVHACGFEAAPLVDGFYDLAISNVPFGDYRVVESKAKTYSRFSIHNYFFAKALEVVRPGGLVAFVTSAYTMDAVNTTVRQYLARKARLVGAFRLPSSTFGQVAGTEVVTDVIVLQRLGQGIEPNPQGWMETERLEGPAVGYTAQGFRCNSWFAKYPEKVIGTFGTTSGMRGTRQLTVNFAGDLRAAIRKQAEAFPSDIYKARTASGELHSYNSKPTMMVSPDLAVPLGSYLTKEGALWVRTSATAACKIEVSGRKLERIIGLIGVRDVARELVAAQVQEDVPEAALIRMRGKLNDAYDAFVRQFGPISDKANVQAFADDPSMPLLRSLEVVDHKTGVVEKAALFSRRTAGGLPPAGKCESLADAVAVVSNRYGGLNLEAIGELVGKDAHGAREALLAEGLAFDDPETGSLVTKDRYLSGNVRMKLLAAEAAGQEYAANVAALQAVLPVDLVPSEIGATLGSPWIPLADYEAWIQECLGESQAKVIRSANSGSFEVTINRYVRARPSGVGALKYGTKRIDAFTLVEQAMNQQAPTIRDKTDDGKYVTNTEATIEARERQEALKAAFLEWLWQDRDRADRLVRIYNDTFNCHVTWEPDGSHLTLPGYSYWHKPSAHQLNGIWRIVAGERNTLLGHVVGAGKTLTMVCAGMELRRLGKARKPMYVVPNHMLEQFGTEFLCSYPSANILVAGKADFQGDKRRTLMSRIATGDWDAVIVTHAMFERIKLAPEFIEDYIEAKIAEIVAEMVGSEREGLVYKDLVKAKKQWEARLNRLAEGKKKDDVLTFDQLGVDRLFVDEANLFKNLFRVTKMTRVAGLPNSNAERAFDMLLKVRNIEELHGCDNGVVFATGTPVANSMAEMWVMQHYLQPRALEETGVAFFDAWASNFGQVVTSIELAPDGSRYRTNQRFARFVNLPELLGMFGEVADVKTAAMLKLPVPSSELIAVVAQASPALKEYVESLVKRSDKIHEGRVKPQEDNMLLVTNDGRKAALDMRLVSAKYRDFTGSKVNLCVERVHEVWVDSAKDRGTQLVFCDLSTPKGKGFNVYDDIKAKLVKRGVPAAEIAFIHDYETDAAKERLYESVRQGVVRVLLGSTSKLGLGTNVQTRLVALHHLDAPWRPADVEQRDGRIVRRGNTNAGVRIFRYVTEGSFDAYMWQTLETKAKFIAQVMSGDRAMRSAEDLELNALSYAEVKALASGNPLVLEKAGVDAEVAKLTILRTQHERRLAGVRREVASLPNAIDENRRLAELYRSEAAAAQDAMRLPLLLADGRSLTTREAKAEALAVARADVETKAVHYALGHSAEVGAWGAFGVSMVSRSTGEGVAVVLKLAGKMTVKRDIPRTGGYILAAMEGMGADFEEAARNYAGYVVEDEARLAGLRTQLDAPFEGAAKLDALLQQQAAVNKALGIFESAAGGLGDDQDQDEAQPLAA
ncbi:hypothetical protein AB7849_15155 [Rhodanobacter sp. 115]|uniref:hypothetical protein n=1 Tax=Rhodanobacter sp. FW021-MT20 TaxID=1162282 RepID=UPI0034E51858